MLDTQLGKTLRKGGDLGHAVGEVRDALRSAMDNSISTADSAAWKEVRKQYANMMAAANSRNAAGDICRARFTHKRPKAIRRSSLVAGLILPTSHGQLVK